MLYVVILYMERFHVVSLNLNLLELISKKKENMDGSFQSYATVFAYYW